MGKVAKSREHKVEVAKREAQGARRRSICKEAVKVVK